MIMQKIKNIFQKHLSLVIVFISFVIVLTNYLIYPTFIAKKMKLADIPVAKAAIAPNTRITEEMIDTISFPKDLLPESVVTKKADLIGKYVKSDYAVHPESFFYETQITENKEEQNRFLNQLSEGDCLYLLKLDKTKQEALAMEKEQSIDLFYFHKDKQEELFFGLLGADIPILDLREVSHSEVILTLRIHKADLSAYVIAENTGEIIPSITIPASDPSMDISKIYSISSTKNYLSSLTTSYQEGSGN